MDNKLIIGIDLSFNSTGITISKIGENNIGEKMEFYRIIFDDNKNKKKIYVPTSIKNLNQSTYRMPTNIDISDLLINIIDDENNFEQMETTLKGMICSKIINKIIRESIDKYQTKEIIVAIENFVMPAFSGKNQLKTVAGLIMLQGFVREFLIRLKIDLNIDLKILTPSPSSVKKFFTGNGNAEKIDMLKAFLTIYDGNKLLPDVTEDSLNKINDVIDSFALMMLAYKTIINNE